MLRCMGIDLLISLIPAEKWQDYFIKHHISECPRCQMKLADVEESRALLILENDLSAPAPAWEAVKAKSCEPKKAEERPHRLRWHWALGTVGAAALLTIVLSIVFLSHRGVNPVAENQSERFQINHIRVDNKPASTFVYRPKDSKIIMVWAGKTP